MKPRINPFLRSAALAAFTLVASASSAFAANGWWNTTDGEWTNVNNWWTTAGGPTLVGTVPAGGQTATFNGTGVDGNQIVYLNGNQAASSLTFANTGTTTLLGGTSATPAPNNLALSGGITVNAGAGAVTFGNTSGTAAANLVFSGNHALNNLSSNVVTVNSGITSSAASGLQTLTLNGAGSLTGFTFNGAIGDGVAGGKIALTIPNNVSSAVYTFNNNNSFSGGFSIAQASVGQTVNLGADNALGSGLVTFSSGGGGGTILLQATGGAKTLTNDFKISGTGGTRASFAGSNSLSISGKFNANSLGVASSITGGTLTLSGDFYLSNTDVASQTATLAGTGNTLISGVIKNNAALTNANASNLNVTNTGITTLANANTYTGTTTLSGAVGSTIQIGNNSAFGSGDISLIGSPTLVASGADRSISNTVVNNGNSRTLSVSGPNTLTLAGPVNLSENTSNRVLTLAGYGNTNISGVISNALSTGSALTISNIGTTTLTGSNAYTGVTIISGGTTKLDFVNAAATDDILYNGVAETTLTVGGHLQLVGKAGVNNVQNIATLTTQGNSAAKVTLAAGSGGTVKLQATTLAANTNNLTDFNIGANSTVNLSGVTANTIAGGGRLTVNDFTDFAWFDSSKDIVPAGANVTATVLATGTGSGATFYKLTDGLTRTSGNFVFKGIRLNSTGVADGTLDLGNLQLQATGGGASTFLYAGGGTNTYNISKGTLTSSNASVAEFAFGITTGATLNIASDAAIEDNLTTGLASILKAGGGTLAINGAKNHTGITRVFGGVLETNSLAPGGSASGIGASVNLAANLRFDGGTLKYTGGVTATDRSFTIDSDGATIDASGSGALTWAPALALTFNSNYLTLTGTNTDANTFGGGVGVLANSGTVKTVLTKSGTGRWVIAGNHTYSGETFVNAGTLEVSGSLGNTPVEVKNTATLGGTGNIGGSVTVRSGGHLAIPVAANPGSQITRSVGQLTLDSGNILDLSAISTPAAGTYTLLTAAGGISGTPTIINQSGVSGTVSIVGGTSLVLTVTGGGNTAPTITAISDLSVSSGGNTGALAFTVGDDLTAPGSLNVSGSSSNTALVPNGNIVFGGSGASRTVTATSVSGLTGTATITVNVSDGSLSTNEPFIVTVTGNYSSWATSNSIPGQPASGDFDNDGVTNLTEYALGLSPTVSSVPTGTLAAGVVTFNKGADAIANGDVGWVIQKSVDLVTWTNEVTQAPGNPALTISYALPTGQPKVFVRLKSTKAP